MKGNVEDLGFYDECVDISHEIEDDTIKGRYCYSGLILPLPNISVTQPDESRMFQVNIGFRQCLCLNSAVFRLCKRL